MLRSKKKEGADASEKPAKKTGLLSKRPKLSTSKADKTPTKEKDATESETPKETKKGLLTRSAKETPKAAERTPSATAKKSVTPKKAAVKTETSKKEKPGPKLERSSAPAVEKSAKSTSSVGAKKTTGKSKTAGGTGSSALTPTARAKSETAKRRTSLSETTSSKGTSEAKSKDSSRGMTPPVPKASPAKKTATKTKSPAVKDKEAEPKSAKKGAANLVRKLTGIGKSKTPVPPSGKEKRKSTESASARSIKTSETTSPALGRLTSQSPAPVPKPRRSSMSSVQSRPSPAVSEAETKKKKKSTKEETPSLASTLSPAPEAVVDKNESVETTEDASVEVDVPEEAKVEASAEAVTAEEVVVISPRSSHEPVQPARDEEGSVDMAPPTTLSARSHSATSRTSLEEPPTQSSDIAEVVEEPRDEVMVDATPAAEEKMAESVKVEPIPENAPVQMDIESSVLAAESVSGGVPSHTGENLEGVIRDRELSLDGFEPSLAADTESVSKMSMDTEGLTSVQREPMASERAESIDQASQRIEDGDRDSLPDDASDQGCMDMAPSDNDLSLPSEADAAYDTDSMATGGAPSEGRDSLTTPRDDGQDQLSMELGVSTSEDRMSLDVESFDVEEPYGTGQRHMETLGGQTKGGILHEGGKGHHSVFQLNDSALSENSASQGLIATSARAESSHAASVEVAADTRSIQLMSEVAEEPEDDDNTARLADLDVFSEARSEAIPEDRTDFDDDLTVPDPEGYRGETFSSSSWSSEDVFASERGDVEDLESTPDPSRVEDVLTEPNTPQAATPPEPEVTEVQQPAPPAQAASPETVETGHLSAPDEMQSRDTPMWDPLQQRRGSRRSTASREKEEIATPIQAPVEERAREWSPLPAQIPTHVRTPEPAREEREPVLTERQVERQTSEPSTVERSATPPTLTAADPVVISTPQLTEKKKTRTSVSEEPSKAPLWDPLSRKKSPAWDPLHQKRVRSSESPTPTHPHTPTVLQAAQKRATSLESVRRTRMPATKPKSKKAVEDDPVERSAGSGDDPFDDDLDTENVEPPCMANPPRPEENEENRNPKGRRGNLIVSCALYVIGGLAVTVLFFRRRG